jgi:hypothetical protein
MQIIFWRLWNGILFGAIVFAVPSAGQPVGPEQPAEQASR